MSTIDDRLVIHSAGLVARVMEVDRLVRAWMIRRAAQLIAAGRDPTVEAVPIEIAEAIIASDHEVEAALRRLTVRGDLVCWRRPRKRWVETGRWVVTPPTPRETAPPQVTPSPVTAEYEWCDENSC